MNTTDSSMSTPSLDKLHVGVSEGSMSAQHKPGRIRLIAEAFRHEMAVVSYCEQARADAQRGKRHMAFWCLDMAAAHRRRYVEARAAIAKAAIAKATRSAS